jgi:hypothetical protein
MGFIFSRVCGEEETLNWNEPLTLISKAVAGFFTARAQDRNCALFSAGCGGGRNNALKKAAYFQKRRRLHYTRVGQKNALYFQVREKETQLY